jgi:hypothetical protein
VLADRSKVSVLLGTAEAVAIGTELLPAARVRMGRGHWPPKHEGGSKP